MHQKLILFLSLLSVSVSAQHDSLHWLPELNVQTRRFDYSEASMQTQHLDTSILSQLSGTTLADRLNRESALFVKSYGSGSLATLSLRGTGAGHTALLWNGIALNSPMLGLYDFNLLPVFLLEDVKVQAGGNGPVVGSGAIGGAVFLDDVPDFRKKIKLRLFNTYGSFNQLQNGLAVELADENIYSQSKFYRQSARNDFYFDRTDGTLRKQTHAQTEQLGFTQNLSYGSVSNHIDLHFWYLQNEREIPALMIAESSLQTQNDKSLRLVANWSVLKNKWFWNLRFGGNQEEIVYVDPAARLDEFSRALSLQSEAEMGYMFSKHLRLMTQIAWYEAQANAENYFGQVHQQQISIGAKIIFERKKWYVNAAMRQGFFDGSTIPFLPAMNLRYEITPALSFRGDVSRVYRVPTLNDRFWIPGGNPNLRPENGYSSSLGIEWNKTIRTTKLQANAGYFYGRLKDALVWIPGANGIFTARNIHELENKGLEMGGSIGFQYGDWKIQPSIKSNIVSSTIIKSDVSFSTALGKQLIYTPELQHLFQCGISFKQFEFRYHHNYTGYRYTTIDHAYFLEPYSIAELHLAWTCPLKTSSLTLSAGIKNLYDEKYQTIAWRAMPGRSYHCGLLFTFGK